MIMMVMIIAVTHSIFKLGPQILHGSRSRLYLWYVDDDDNDDDDNDNDDDDNDSDNDDDNIYTCNSVNF